MGFHTRMHATQLQVAYAWATSLNEDEAAALLRRLNLGEGVVDYAMEVGAFSHAFQLAQLAAKQRLPDVHLKYAMFLEDSGRFVEAEAEFVAAGAHLLGAACVRWRHSSATNHCRLELVYCSCCTYHMRHVHGLNHAATMSKAQAVTPAECCCVPCLVSPLCDQASRVRPLTCTCTTRTGLQLCGWRSGATRRRTMTSTWRRYNPVGFNHCMPGM